MDIQNTTIGCIGCGTMGGAVLEAIAKKYGGTNIVVSAKHFEKAQAFAARIGATALPTNAAVAERAQIVFIAVKPAFVTQVLAELRPVCTAPKAFVSMAAGIPLATLSDALSAAPHKPHLIRIMPNLPATQGEAMTALCTADQSAATEQDGARTQDATFAQEATAAVTALLQTAGRVEQVPEKLMDAVTAVSGSGPAYVFLFIEALADAAVRFGMPRAQAYTYAAQTVRGAATLALNDGRSISELKDAVCSPAGTTIEGVAALERGGFRGTVIEAATAAFAKSVALGK